MGSISYSLKGGLDKKQLETIYKDVLQVLEKVGVEINHGRTLRSLSGRDGVVIKGTRVRYRPYLVEEFIGKLYCEGKKEAANRFKMQGGYHCSNTLDMDTGKIRPSTSKDLIKMVKLFDALDIEGGAPVVITDVSKSLEAVTAFKICWENSRKVGGYEIPSIKELKYIHEMAQVVGKRINEGVQVVTSPLKLNSEALDLLWQSLDEDIYLEARSGAMPMLGATSPIFFPAAWAEAIADGLAGYISTKLISEGKRGKFDIRLDPFDMKYGNIVFGSPEWILIYLMNGQLNEHFLGYHGGGRFRSTAKEPDVQAGAERGMSLLVQALAGARNFYGAGQMAIDEVFSPEQLIIDKEILNYTERVVKGFEFADEEGLSLKVIKEVGPGGTFLDHPSTVESFRKTYWMPDLFEHYRLGQWQEKGMPSIRELARNVAQEKIKSHHFELDKESKKELNKIYQKACQELGG